MNNFLFGGVAAAMFVAASAAAQPAAPPAPAPAPQVQVMRIQREPMRVQTRDEVVKHVRDLFARLDTNRDGFLTRDEAGSAKQAMGGEIRERFAKRLAEGGGPKFDRGAAFDRLDTNKDGMVSRQEFLAAQPRVRTRVFTMRDGEGPVEVGGEPGQPHVKVMRMRGMGMRGRMFERGDANHDGKLSLQEATNAALQHFDAADVNRDGKLTPDERMQMRQRIKIQRQPA